MGGNEKRPGSARTPRARTQEVSAPMPASGYRLKQARKRRGLTQGALAELVGVGRITIIRVENGATVPSVRLALAISRELGETVETLFGGGAS
jgi:putative transcriptional regulator